MEQYLTKVGTAPPHNSSTMHELVARKKQQQLRMKLNKIGNYNTLFITFVCVVTS